MTPIFKDAGEPKIHKCGKPAAYRVVFHDINAIEKNVCSEHFNQATSLVKNAGIGCTFYPDTTGKCDVEYTTEKNIHKLVVERRETP